MTKILLVDNGSLKAAATLTLRNLAAELARMINQPVDAVSLQHANKISQQRLHGRPAWVLKDYLAQQLDQGHRKFLLVPLFFSLNRALTVFVPETLSELKKSHGEFECVVCDVLFRLGEADDDLARILYQNALATAHSGQGIPRQVVLVDHGSPSPRVTAVRESLGRQLQSLLGQQHSVSQAAMERRPGREYDFNGPLLEDWLTSRAAEQVDAVLVCLLFLLPGRHAGAGGDIESICARVCRQFTNFKVSISPLVSDNPGLIKLLEKRVRDYL